MPSMKADKMFHETVFFLRKQFEKLKWQNKHPLFKQKKILKKITSSAEM